MQKNNLNNSERMPALIGKVVRTLRAAQGVSVNQLGVAADLEPANLSRFERGIPGGVHASKHLSLIASSLGTRASVLYAIAEKASADAEFLDNPENVLSTAKELTEVIEKFLKNL